MASCKDCIHYEVCKNHYNICQAHNLNLYKDRTRFVELPCKVGDTVYFATKDRFNSATIDEITITDNGMQFYWLQYDKSYEITEIWDDGTFSDKDIGKTVFLTREEAEKALKELPFTEWSDKKWHLKTNHMMITRLQSWTSLQLVL